jgi:hypothetical protein
MSVRAKQPITLELLAVASFVVVSVGAALGLAPDRVVGI